MRDGKKVGFTAGAFDLCHAGHMLMFKEAKTVCDYLIVGLHSDPTIDRPETKNKPIMSVEEREIILEGITYIDEIITYDTEADLLRILSENTPGIDVRILGEEYKDKQYTGRDLPLPVYFNSRGHGYSTTELRKRVYDAEKQKNGA
ncbi:glycerol-3-phosphate cytidylyltransferase [Candidatus Kaiserbacteria bacterium CG10_big_fil_rev_8_21_14_0_10_51_14]|uniref:Glycerol-3-phosphate cytidylyltransferase n=1 Tax=Candidatus Kaiserbacteria bacterium CG10_big_fil_rev_8_21_14_0_10_51_14 TaxID=1974610 RepID=A0A2H0UE14_9BACT|nr:MAG: glycerol-3-phosphate cytidylyltransferase [Candidatus Kaiserbacteria bacterium CG10_big_fil_rev_8_21_14_0_10_51_14]